MCVWRYVRACFGAHGIAANTGATLAFKFSWYATHIAVLRIARCIRRYSLYRVELPSPCRSVRSCVSIRPRRRHTGECACCAVHETGTACRCCSIVGSLNKIPLALLGIVLFNSPVNGANMIAITFGARESVCVCPHDYARAAGLGAGIVYSFVKLQQKRMAEARVRAVRAASVVSFAPN